MAVYAPNAHPLPVRFFRVGDDRRFVNCVRFHCFHVWFLFRLFLPAHVSCSSLLCIAGRLQRQEQLSKRRCGISLFANLGECLASIRKTVVILSSTSIILWLMEWLCFIYFALYCFYSKEVTLRLFLFLQPWTRSALPMQTSSKIAPCLTQRLTLLWRLPFIRGMKLNQCWKQFLPRYSNRSSKPATLIRSGPLSPLPVHQLWRLRFLSRFLLLLVFFFFFFFFFFFLILTTRSVYTLVFLQPTCARLQTVFIFLSSIFLIKCQIVNFALLPWTPCNLVLFWAAAAGEPNFICENHFGSMPQGLHKNSMKNLRKAVSLVFWLILLLLHQLQFMCPCFISLISVNFLLFLARIILIRWNFSFLFLLLVTQKLRTAFKTSCLRGMVRCSAG